MTARLEEARTAAAQTSVRLFRETRRAAWAAARVFPPRSAADWPATNMGLEPVVGLLGRRRSRLSTAQRPRIAEIRDNLIARISEAKHQG